ncbi:Hpt domain-containing protein [Rugamonas apoptosis]|uniref:Hpt domain-containing protein n=1 Tax=Rugamonas apoptosis TaxID=2758570 RepID=A0A7W2F6S5_9BURK|nr:Hpt domain-containing protein [Rugamonas apoptosis]MBA5686138.1 Hpt domain-containing protein [Rugamonas apoptosis]
MTLSNVAGLHFSFRDTAILCVSDGLERLMGDRALYLQLLGRFRDDYRGLGPRLRQALADNVLATLRHRVHTLRGAAGMIGARTVCQLATALEPACHLPPPACAETVMLLDEALCGLLAAIDTVLDEAREAAPAGTMPAEAEADAALLDRLARLLDTGDGAAIDVLEQSASPLAARLGVERYQRVAAAAHQFDFEAALAALAPPL